MYSTGTVKIAQSLANNRGGSVYLTIIATDMHPDTPKSSSADVEIIITDVNNHAPVFEKDYYAARAREDAVRYSRIIQITATDADTGRDGWKERKERGHNLRNISIQPK